MKDGPEIASPHLATQLNLMRRRGFAEEQVQEFRAKEQAAVQERGYEEGAYAAPPPAGTLAGEQLLAGAGGEPTQITQIGVEPSGQPIFQATREQARPQVQGPSYRQRARWYAEQNAPGAEAVEVGGSPTSEYYRERMNVVVGAFLPGLGSIPSPAEMSRHVSSELKTSRSEIKTGLESYYMGVMTNDTRVAGAGMVLFGQGATRRERAYTELERYQKVQEVSEQTVFGANLIASSALSVVELAQYVVSTARVARAVHAGTITPKVGLATVRIGGGLASTPLEASQIYLARTIKPANAFRINAPRGTETISVNFIGNKPSTISYPRMVEARDILTGEMSMRYTRGPVPIKAAPAQLQSWANTLNPGGKMNVSSVIKVQGANRPYPMPVWGDEGPLFYVAERVRKTPEYSKVWRAVSTPTSRGYSSIIRKQPVQDVSPQFFARSYSKAPSVFEGEYAQVGGLRRYGLTGEITATRTITRPGTQFKIIELEEISTGLRNARYASATVGVNRTAGYAELIVRRGEISGASPIVRRAGLLMDQRGSAAGSRMMEGGRTGTFGQIDVGGMDPYVPAQILRARPGYTVPALRFLQLPAVIGQGRKISSPRLIAFPTLRSTQAYRQQPFFAPRVGSDINVSHITGQDEKQLPVATSRQLTQALTTLPTPNIPGLRQPKVPNRLQFPGSLDIKGPSPHLLGGRRGYYGYWKVYPLGELYPLGRPAMHRRKGKRIRRNKK